MAGPRFSIIIPHYDIPDLLMRCLDSIPVTEDIQVLVVDDNSPGADSYREKYPALSRPFLKFVRTNRGGGAGYARNVGLEYAEGEWLLFADADDFFATGMYELIASHADSEADLVFFRKKGVCSDDVHQESNQDLYLDSILDEYLRTGDEWPLRTRFIVPWAKMIRRELIIKNNIRFDEVKYANDCFFSVCSGYYARTIEVVDKVLYFKTQRPESLSTDFCAKPDELKIRAEVAFRVDQFLLQNNMCRKHLFTEFWARMLKKDRSLFKYYYENRIDELYPSRFYAFKDLSRVLVSQIKYSLHSRR